jgi:glycosyltransferase involved in cell wall biosynthesis
MSEPLVSVFLPTYNQEEYIGEAIESALKQDYENIEIVIGDDHSQDGTWEIVTKYTNNYSEKITAFRNEKNLGVTENFNKLLQKCEGKYIAFHAGDDIFSESKINTQVDLMEDDNSVVLCYHNTECFDKENDHSKFYWNSRSKASRPVVGKCENVAKEVVRTGNRFIAATSVMARRDSIPNEGFNEKIPVASDWLMWFEICARNSGKVKYINECLGKYRMHENNVSNSKKDIKQDKFVTLAIIEARYPKYRDAVRKQRGHLYYTEAVSEILDGDGMTGRRRLNESIRQSLYSWKWIGWWLYSWLIQLQNKK